MLHSLGCKQNTVLICSVYSSSSVQTSISCEDNDLAYLQVTGWYASVTVDNTTYRVMGDAPVPAIPTANQTSVEFTATQTNFVMQAGPVIVNASFLSPIEVSLIMVILGATTFAPVQRSTNYDCSSRRTWSASRCLSPTST